MCPEFGFPLDYIFGSKAPFYYISLCSSGKPLHNAIVWLDNRTQDIVKEMIAVHHKDVHLQKTGLPLSTYFRSDKKLFCSFVIEVAKNGHLSKPLRCRLNYHVEETQFAFKELFDTGLTLKWDLSENNFSKLIKSSQFW
jgi:hypothetical protein